MKELIFTKPSPIGEVRITLRIIKNKLYFRYNQNQMSQQAIASFKEKGVKFKMRRGWLEVDFFKENNVVKLGEEIIDLEEDNTETIENKLAEFYTIQYIKNGFKLE